MHSSYCIYEGESTNNYVSEVKELPPEIQATIFNVKTFFFILGRHLCLSVKSVHSLAMSNHFSNIDSLGKSLTHSCLWRLFGSVRAESGALLSRSGLKEALYKWSE